MSQLLRGMGFSCASPVIATTLELAQKSTTCVTRIMSPEWVMTLCRPVCQVDSGLVRGLFAYQVGQSIAIFISD